jgi:hypothetical protein
MIRPNEIQPGMTIDYRHTPYLVLGVNKALGHDFSSIKLFNLLSFSPTTKRIKENVNVVNIPARTLIQNHIDYFEKMHNAIINENDGYFYEVEQKITHPDGDFFKSYKYSILVETNNNSRTFVIWNFENGLAEYVIVHNTNTPYTARQNTPFDSLYVFNRIEEFILKQIHSVERVLTMIEKAEKIAAKTVS